MSDQRSYVDLSPQERIKCAKFLPIYGDEQRSVELTQLVRGNSNNSLKSVLLKLYRLTNDDAEWQKYYSKLMEQFQLHEEVTEGGIIARVSKVRRELGLQPYVSKLSSSCLEDFERLFIVNYTMREVVVNSKTKPSATRKVKAGYTPIFVLRP